MIIKIITSEEESTGIKMKDNIYIDGCIRSFEDEVQLMGKSFGK